MASIDIYVDDSGQLNTSYKSPYFIYGGYWCFSDQSHNIAQTYGKLMKQIYRTKHEVKTSDMQDKSKRKVMRRVLRNHGHCMHPIYIATYVPKLTIDFKDKQAVQLHKNYILRRLVEDVIVSIEKKGISVKKINVFIDNQTQTKVNNRDSLELYIKRYFSKANYYQTISHNTTKAAISVKFLDSKHFRNMQLSDLFANCKFSRYEYNCSDYNSIYKELLITPLCRKHPLYFTANSLPIK